MGCGRHSQPWLPSAFTQPFALTLSGDPQHMGSDPRSSPSFNLLLLILTAPAPLQVFVPYFHQKCPSLLYTDINSTQSPRLGLSTTYSRKPLMIILVHSALFPYSSKFPPASLPISRSFILVLLTHANVGVLRASSWAHFSSLITLSLFREISSP